MMDTSSPVLRMMAFFSLDESNPKKFVPNILLFVYRYLQHLHSDALFVFNQPNGEADCHVAVVRRVDLAIAAEVEAVRVAVVKRTGPPASVAADKVQVNIIAQSTKGHKD